METFDGALSSIKDQYNQTLCTWHNFEHSFNNLKELLKYFKGREPQLDLIDIDCNVSQCRLSLLLDMMGGPHVHITGGAGNGEGGYWGWAVHYDGERLANGSAEAIALYVHSFLTAKKFWENKSNPKNSTEGNSGKFGSQNEY